MARDAEAAFPGRDDVTASSTGSSSQHVDANKALEKASVEEEYVEVGYWEIAKQ